MDPNETLEQLRDAIARLSAYLDAADPDPNLSVADDVIEMFNSLDEWLSRGGFRPDDWRYRIGAGP
jgi:hypothetical protein